MLTKIKIAHKIYILGGSQLLLIAIIGLVAINQMSKIGIELVDIAEQDIPLTRFISKVTEHQLTQNIYFERAIFHSVIADQDELHSTNGVNQDRQKVEQLGKTILTEINLSIEFTANAIKQAHTNNAKVQFQRVSASLSQLKVLQAEVLKNMQETMDLAAKRQLKLMVKKAKSFEIQQDQLQQLSTQLLHDIQTFTLTAALKAEADEQSGIRQIIFWFCIALMLGTIAPIVISRSITGPINELIDRLREVAEGDGDLTVTLAETAQDESGDVARAFNQFIGMIRLLITTTSGQAGILSQSSQTATEVMNQTVSNVQQQQVETDMVATAVTEMSSATHEVAMNAAHAATVTDNVKERVNEGKEVAMETQTIIKKLASEVDESSAVIKSLVQETNSIASVLESIQGIAGQTNLLALNAAIEAARAGESGRGFAVVADEVRALAQSTQKSTVDIQNLLDRLQTEASNAVTSMQKGSESAQQCLLKSAATSETFRIASNAVNEISDLNVQIATAAEEQAQVAEEINKSLLNISRLADVTTAGAKTTADANNNIAKNVAGLNENLSVFSV